MISGLYCGVNEVFAALGCQHSVDLLVMFGDSLSVPLLDDGADRLS